MAPRAPLLLLAVLFLLLAPAVAHGAPRRSLAAAHGGSTHAPLMLCHSFASLIFGCSISSCLELVTILLQMMMRFPITNFTPMDNAAGVVEQEQKHQTRDAVAAAAAGRRWSATVRRGGGGHGGHGGHGRGHGEGRGRPDRTPGIFYPRTVTGGHHSAAAATTTGPGRPAARAMVLLVAATAVVLLLRL